MSEQKTYNEVERRAFFKNKYKPEQMIEGLLNELIELEKAYYLTLDNSKYISHKFGFLIKNLPSLDDVNDLIKRKEGDDFEGTDDLSRLYSLQKILKAREEQDE